MSTAAEMSVNEQEKALAKNLNHPMAMYNILRGATTVLLASGVAMVASASSIFSLTLYGGNAYALVEKQLMFAVVGYFGMMAISRRDAEFFKKVSHPLLWGSVGALAAVLVIGTSVNGQTNWIALGPLRVQPSEFAKLAVILWGAQVLASREHELHIRERLLRPYALICALIIFLIIAEGDLGTAMIIAPIMASALYFVGAPSKWFAYTAAAGLSGIVILTVMYPYRMQRFTSWLNPGADPQGTGYQLLHGQRALGSGGWLGVGLGGSLEKWGTLPEAHTDFIYAVVGEEVGIAGTIAVLVLFSAIIFVGLRLARLSNDRFVQLTTLGIVTWLVTQLFVNVGAVLGLMPITGVPLPLVSYGGSSLIPTLGAIGVLLSFARKHGESVIAQG